jgi:hypothetical protein
VETKDFLEESTEYHLWKPPSTLYQMETFEYLGETIKYLMETTEYKEDEIC